MATTDVLRFAFGEPRVVPAGWPPDVAPHDVITAGHMNAVKSSVYQWPGNVNGGGFNLTSLGNVGIGTASPTSALEVKQSINPRANVTFLNLASGGTGKMRLRLGPSNGFDLTDLYPYIEAYSVDVTQNAGLAFGTYYAGVVGERMRIDASGNVGIGTASPAGRLDVIGPGELQLVIGTGTGSESYSIGRHAATGFLNFTGYQDSFSGYRFLTTGPGGGEVMRIVNNGRIGLGRSDPGMKVHLYGAGQAQTIYSSAGPHEATLLLQDTGLGVNNGGAILFGAGYGAGYFAGIKGCGTSGADQSTGDMLFLARMAAGHYHLSEVMRILSNGWITIPYLPGSNPGAGTKALWYDPADGNRVKFAA